MTRVRVIDHSSASHGSRNWVGVQSMVTTVGKSQFRGGSTNQDCNIVDGGRIAESMSALTRTSGTNICHKLLSELDTTCIYTSHLGCIDDGMRVLGWYQVSSTARSVPFRTRHISNLMLFLDMTTRLRGQGPRLMLLAAV